MGKAFDGCYSVFAWIYNHVMGAIFIAGGVWLISAGENLWMGLMTIGVGIYFLWTKRWTKKVLDVVSGPEGQAPVAGAPAGEAVPMASEASALAANTAPAPTAAPPVPRGSLTSRKKIVRDGFAIAGVLFLYLGVRALTDDLPMAGLYVVLYGVPAAACGLVSARIRIDRAEDAMPAPPWGELIRAAVVDTFGRLLSRLPRPSAPGAEMRTPDPVAPAPTADVAAPAPAAPVYTADAVTPAPAVSTAPVAPTITLPKIPPRTVLLVAVGALVLVGLVFIGSAVRDRFFGPASGTGMEQLIGDVIPGTGLAETRAWLDSVSDGDTKTLYLTDCGTGDEYTVPLKRVYRFYIESDEVNLERFFEHAQANVGGVFGIGYSEEGIFGLSFIWEEQEAESEPVVDEGYLPPEDSVPLPGEGLVPDHFRELPDLLATAREDGTSRVSEVVFDGRETAAAQQLRFRLADTDPPEWYTIDPHEPSASYYVDGSEATVDDILAAASSADTLWGMIIFNVDDIQELWLSTNPERPTDGY